MFRELEELVFAQGEVIDNIERNVGEAKDYVDRAVDVLVVAKRAHRGRRKKMLWVFCAVFVVVVLLVVIVPVAVRK